MKSLVSEHLQLKDEPLLLALYFAPERDPQDIFVFEVIDGFGADSVDPDQDLFEVTYSSHVGFPVDSGQELHLVLTNRREIEVAFRDGWEVASEIREAVRRNDYRIIYMEPAAQGLMEIIRGE